MKMYMPNMELHIVIHCLPLLVLLAVEAIGSNNNATEFSRSPRTNRRVVRLYSGTRPEPIVCHSEGFQADPANCAVFYRCMKSGRGRFMSFKFQCAPGTVFDPDTEVCNYPSTVKRSNCGLENILTANDQLQDNVIEEVRQELPSPITTKVLLDPKKFSSSTALPSSKRQNLSNPNPWINYLNKRNELNSISTKSPIHKTSDREFTQYNFTSTRKQRSTTPRASSVSRKPSTPQNDDLCRSEGFIGDTENCRKFYRCINNLRGGFLRYEFMCTESTIWDDDIQSCNHAWAVKKRRCGRGNTNEVIDVELNTNQDIPEDAPNHVTPNNNLEQKQTFVMQPQGTSEIITKRPFNTDKKSTKNMYTAISNNLIDVRQTQYYTETLTSPSPKEEYYIGYDNMNKNYKNQSDSNECSESGFMKDKKDCKKFYRCVDNGGGSYTKYEFSCGEGTVWDSNLEACNHEWAVKECGDKGSTQTPEIPISTITSTKSTTTYTSTSQTMTDDNNDIGYGNQDQNLSTTKSPISTSTTQVTKQPGSNCTSSGFMGDENDCKIFYRCVDNGDGSYIQYQFTCGDGTVWDSSIEACNHIWAVKECGGKGTTKAPLQGEATTTLSPSVTTIKPTQSTQNNQSTVETTIDESENGGYGNQQQETISTKTEPPSYLSTTSVTKRPGNNCTSSGFMGDENNCKIFYRCVDKGDGDYIRYEFSCGEGTVWDPKIEACNHPWAVENCGDSSSFTTEKIEPSIPITEPHTTLSTGLTQNDDIDGNYGIQHDDSSSPQSDISSSPITTTKQPLDSSNDCVTSGFIGDKFDCKKFYRCVDNGNGGFTRYEFSCGEGTVWDPKIDACNHAWAVKSCGGSLNNEINKEEITTTRRTTTYSSSTSTTSSENEIDTGYGQSSSPSTIPSPGSSLEENEVQTHEECKSSGFVGDKQNCKKFYRCVDNGNGGYTRYEFTCGEGTVWDQEIQGCNHESSRKCSSNSTNVTNQSVSTTEATTPSTTTLYTNDANENDQSSTGITNDKCTSEGFHPNTKDCKKFYRCVDNGKGGYTKYEFSCGEGTMWVQDIQACDHQDGDLSCSSNVVSTTNTQQSEDPQSTTASQASSITSSSTTDLTERPHDEYQDNSSNVSMPQNDSCSSEGFYPNKKDCKKFYRCVDNGQGMYTKYDFICGEGTAWDTDIQTCNHISEVPRCQNEESPNKPMQDEEVSQRPENSDSTQNQTTEASGNDETTSKNSCESEGYFGNKQYCTKFYRCVDNGNGGYTKYDFDCGEGTIWDQDITTCNHPQDVVNPSCNQQSGTSSSSTTSTQPSDTNNTSQGTTNCSQENTTKKPVNQNVTCEKAGYYANPNDCKKFYRCVDWDGKGEKFSVYHFECGEGTIWDPQLDTCNHEESVYPPRDCSGVQSQNENNIQETSTSSSQQPTESTTQDSTTTEQTTTTEKSTTEDTSTTSEQTTAQETTTQKSTTEKTTQESTTTERTTTQQLTTTDESTTQQSSTTESTTTQQSTSTEGTTTTEGSTTQQTITEASTTEKSTTSDSTTTLQTTTTEETTSQDSTIMESTTTQQTTTTESTTAAEQSTTEQTTTQQSTTSQTSTTEESTDGESTTESMSTTEQMDNGSTTQSTNTDGTPPKECPETDEDQYLYVCPTSFKRHPKYCNMFYQCTEDDENHEPKIAVFTCPNNTIYDESQTQCVEENKADKKCDGQIAQQRRIKRLDKYHKEPIVVGKERYSCSSTGYYQFEKTSECSPAFLKCQKVKSGQLRGFVHLCPEGYLYWSISKRCERKENLKDCKTSFNDWSRRWEIPIERKNVA